MPININVGLSKKVGLPHYSSLAASCSVQIEAGHGLLEGNPDEFQRRVQETFAACRCAVEDELARQQGSDPSNPAYSTPHPAAVPPHHGGNGNGHRNAENSPAASNAANGQNGHAASERQFSYARQLAKQIRGLGLRRLETLAQEMCGKPLAALSSVNASGLIDTLKAIKAGEINLDAVLNGGTP